MKVTAPHYRSSRYSEVWFARKFRLDCEGNYLIGRPQVPPRGSVPPSQSMLINMLKAWGYGIIQTDTGLRFTFLDGTGILILPNQFIRWVWRHADQLMQAYLEQR